MNHKIVVGMSLFLQTSLFIVLCLLVGTRANADSEFYYHYFKERRPLELNPEAIAVFSFEGDTESNVAANLSRAGLAGFGHRPFGDGWTLFERAAASATPEIAPGSRPAVASLIEAISRRRDNPYFLSPVFRSGATGLAIVPPDVLVRFRADVPVATAELLIRAAGGSTCQYDWGGMTNAYTVDPHTLSGIRALALANRLAEMAEVEWAEPGFIVSAEPSCAPLSPIPPTDPSFGQSWGLEQLTDIDLDARAAWAICAGSPTIKIAIIDDGVDLAHEDLNVVQGVDCVNPPPPWVCGHPTFCVPGGGPVATSHNHGTTVAGVAAALANGSPARGSLGIAPKIGLVSIRTQAITTIDPRHIVSGLLWAESNGVRVTNLSWNRTGFPGGPDAACLTTKYRETRARGMVHFASVGNGDQDSVWWPATIPDVKAVSAIDAGGNRWVTTPGSFGSNYGPEVMFSAPGGAIYTTDRMGSAGYNSTSNYTTQNGTSYAAPFAAGIAALVFSERPDLSAYAVETILCQSAVDAGPPGRDSVYGCGIVNAAQALEVALTTVFIDGFESGDDRWWSEVVP